MSDKVLVVVPGLGALALAPDTYRQALAEGAALAGAQQGAKTPAGDEPLLDAEQLAAKLSIPTTWLEAAARDGRVPCVRAGRWVRFSRAAVEAALAANKGAA
jgi:excisionase family DNA binding protein